MITIDTFDDVILTTERRPVRAQPKPGLNGAAPFDLYYQLAQGYHQQRLWEAQRARLCKLAGSDGPALDVQRYLENKKIQILTLAERYARRSR
jgi:hypothetical protein